MLVQNPDGDTYYTVVDKEGKRVFEPKKDVYKRQMQEQYTEWMGLY